MGMNPYDQQIGHWTKAVHAREDWYQGQDEARDRAPLTPEAQANAKTEWAVSLPAKELVAENRWQMMQSVAVGLVATNKLLSMMVQEQRRTNQLLFELVKKGQQ